MASTNFDFDLAKFEDAYSDLFKELKAAGWRDDCANETDIDLEPYWLSPFPMHNLARQFLIRFRCVTRRPITLDGTYWKGVQFGCQDCYAATSLKHARPYDVERLILQEKYDVARPPAFPIGIMKDWMIFLREDWSSITVNYCWRDALLSSNPFEVIDEFRRGGNSLWDNPEHHIEINDPDRVPPEIYRGAFSEYDD
ncbi:hypothetical protein [Burkholderia sp. S-53]|uniref:hypothetical protein n=1 Tax=Burkholderia sp. S-53 TaxID=2906514 RepID=UPI0021CEA93F|nr:hypothetical protein [Burkholderia sp. S-53]UXU91099.1 hypothetical protein LXM88_23265 [Burkholderia sp. S-53]